MSTVEATVLFTDIEGSTERWDRHPEAMRRALERHDEVLRAAFGVAGVRVFKHTGDGMIVVGEDPATLIAAAVEAQHRLASSEWDDVGGLRVRMGLHRGRFHARDDDLFGADMNLAARIMSGAGGGQIVASAATLEGLDVPSGCQPEDLGRFRFRGVQDPVVVIEVQYPGGGPHPPYRSSEHDLGNLPAAPEHLVGRAEETLDLAARIREPGLVTLVGPGGVGKTSLALTVAADARPAFPDGLWFADLASIGSREDVALFVAQVLRLERPADGTTAETLAHVVATRSLLLVLDNCEHVIGDVRAALGAILGAHPKATILATSQEAIGHAAERVVAVAPLGLDDAHSASVDLFVARAQQIDPAYTADASTRAEILALCRQLDGLPLAIELAASRMAALGLADIVAHLSERFRLLEGPGTGRHDALERTIGWSHDLLDDEEQQLLRRVALFDGAFDVTQAAAAAGVSALAAADALARLVSRSMITRQAGATPPAFHLLESVRHFARSRLRDAGEEAKTRTLIAEHVVQLGAVARAWIDGPDQLQWFDRLERELPSVRIAVDHLIEHDPVGALDLLVGLYQFWMARASRHDALRWIEAAYERAVAPDPGLASRALADAATFAYFCGHLPQSRALCERSILVSEQGAQPARPTALLRLAALQAFDGDPEAAVTTGAQALDTLDATHVPPEPPETMAAIGAFLAIVGQAERGVEVCRAAIDRHVSPSPTTEASDLLNLAYAHRLLDPDEAVTAYQAALVRARVAGSPFYVATAAMGAGLSLRAAGRGDEALVLLAEALPMARDIGMRDEVLVMLKAAARILRVDGSVDGDLLFLVAEREQQARHWEGGPTLGRRPSRSPSDVAAEIGLAYADLRDVAAELDVDQAIDLVERAAARVHAPSGG